MQQRFLVSWMKKILVWLKREGRTNVRQLSIIFCSEAYQERVRERVCVIERGRVRRKKKTQGKTSQGKLRLATCLKSTNSKTKNHSQSQQKTMHAQKVINTNKIKKMSRHRLLEVNDLHTNNAVMNKSKHRRVMWKGQIIQVACVTFKVVK